MGLLLKFASGKFNPVKDKEEILNRVEDLLMKIKTEKFHIADNNHVKESKQNLSRLVKDYNNFLDKLKIKNDE